jgi:hypothetical protein
VKLITFIGAPRKMTESGERNKEVCSPKWNTNFHSCLQFSFKSLVFILALNKEEILGSEVFPRTFIASH